ncbi:hypothetical protein [Prolixibacter denitrificans]|uniref:Uncharacterized protein n=1 Tax=Prolixibacter denitrificans TaxID=1541063 RepID=A0A2P8CHP1_9BACT|nr:hypothetical protein [Prolixibacter denitrificans]PSK84495.1 hypothetical protein CLV93_102283 [Prolixibacter denitrificans]GET20668.1 hypothetical protein JCM18694_09140 [Prolixibacter denitrificans]
MKYRIPRFLYRGDNDHKNKRELKNTLSYYQLQSNLINGGVGREIIEKPLFDLINKHVDTGWSETHFLSFSESEDIALRLGLHCELDKVVRNFMDYQEYFENDKDWDFALIALDTDKMSLVQVGQGVYEGFYSPSLKEFEFQLKYRIVLIDVVRCLDNQKGYEEAKKNSERDREWLVLPATVKQLNFGVENSGILDGACIHEIKKYKRY